MLPAAPLRSVVAGHPRPEARAQRQRVTPLLRVLMQELLQDQRIGLRVAVLVRLVHLHEALPEFWRSVREAVRAALSLHLLAVGRARGALLRGLIAGPGVDFFLRSASREKGNETNDVAHWAPPCERVYS